MKIVRIDYENGKLIFWLDAIPSVEWIKTFRGLQGQQPYLVGSEPEDFTFIGAKARIAATAMTGVQITANFQVYVARTDERIAQVHRKPEPPSVNVTDEGGAILAAIRSAGLMP